MPDEIAQSLMRTSETTRPVKVTGIIPGDPPSVLTYELVPLSGGRFRPFSQMVQVRDAELFARMTAEVGRGDFIRATVVTVWPEGGRYYTYLADFCKVDKGEEPTSAPELAAAAR